MSIHFARKTGLVLISATLLVAISGCWGRAIREGMGAMRGASGRFIALQPATGLQNYGGYELTGLRARSGVQLPDQFLQILTEAIHEDLRQELDWMAGATSRLRISCEIIHFEAGDMVDQAVGPIKETIMDCELQDAGTGQSRGRANLVGRSTATTSSGRRSIAGGAAKALRKWLIDGGVPKGSAASDD